MPVPPNTSSPLEPGAAIAPPPGISSAVLDHLPDVVIRYDAAGRILYVNDAFVAVTGTPRDQIVGRHAQELAVSPQTIDAFGRARRTAFETGRVVSFDIRRDTPSGERCVEYCVIPEKRADGVVETVIAVGRDVTERERERAWLAEAQRIAHMGSWTWDVATGVSRASDEIVEILGTPDAARDPVQTLFARLAPEERARFTEVSRRLYEERPERSENVWHIIRPDGGSRHVHTRSVWTYDDAGRRVRGAGTFQDVTEQVEAAAELERQHAMLEASQRIARVGSWELDVLRGTVRWSSEMYRIAGLSPDDAPISLERVRALVHPDDRTLVHDRTEAATTTGEPQEYEWRLVCPDGTTRLVHTRTTTVHRSGSVTIIGTCQDVTARRALEDQVRQSQKMDALGLLAGSIAHDFNNLLSAILGGAELARLDVPDGSDAARDLDDVRHAAARAAQITQQLLAFSRKQAPRPHVLDVRDVVRGAEKLLRRLLPENVAFDLALGAEPAVVRADQGQLEQVLLNLVVNARDAIADADAVAPGLVTVEVSRAKEHVEMSVRDTGVGMDDETRARIFEPFFSTKGSGKGTGIGLATVLGIASQSGGSVHVESEPGVGSTFTLRLPLVHAPVEKETLRDFVLPSGTETILLVEDESLVREAAARILERHGYRVLTARHGADALLVWRAHAAEIALLVTDLRMPEMGGQALVHALRAERPALPVVVMSGYASGRRDGEKALLEDEVFLAKPFSAESLLVLVRTALSGEPAELR